MFRFYYCLLFSKPGVETSQIQAHLLCNLRRLLSRYSARAQTHASKGGPETSVRFNLTHFMSVQRDCFDRVVSGGGINGAQPFVRGFCPFLPKSSDNGSKSGACFDFSMFFQGLSSPQSAKISAPVFPIASVSSRALETNIWLISSFFVHFFVFFFIVLTSKIWKSNFSLFISLKTGP